MSRSAGARRLRGQSLVELAIALPVLLLLFAGGTDLARAYFVGTEVADAARAAALYVAANPPSPGPYSASFVTAIDDAATAAYQGSVLSCSSTPLITLSPLSAPSQASPPNPLTDSYTQDVTVVCNLQLLTPLLGPSVKIKATSASQVTEP